MWAHRVNELISHSSRQSATKGFAEDGVADTRAEHLAAQRIGAGFVTGKEGRSDLDGACT
nr:hypothetical protein [Paraburkholderia sp. BCC1885]